MATIARIDSSGPAAAPRVSGRAAARSLGVRVRLAAGAVGAAVLGVAPHVLHHAGPLAGAALFAGLGGSLLFAALGFVAAIPLLLRVRRRSGSWRAPLAILVAFAALYTVSAAVVGPAITGEDDPQTERAPQPARPGHEGHHQ